MNFYPEQFQNFADVLNFHAEECPDAEVIRHSVKDGESPVVTRYGELNRQARAIAAYLQSHLGPVTGERCLLMLPSGAEFAAAFFACFQAGAIAVPAFPPENNRQAYLDRLIGIIRDAKPKAVLGLSGDLGRYREQLSAVLPADGRLVAVDQVPLEYSEALQPHRIGQDDLAFLQYTSGSTSAPKGVMVSHANLMANERSMAATFGANDQEVWVNWLPLFHDMGLMAGLLLPILHGHCVHLMTPQFFLGRPARWLEAISQNRGTFSGGPDFAYRLCAERLRDEEIANLDLSSWRMAFTGSEPIRPETLDRFAERFAPCGFRKDALAPSYGLAEATLFVCSRDLGSETREFRFNDEQMIAGPAQEAARVSKLVGCGWADDDHDIQLMNTETLSPAAEGEVGEIWVAGPSVTQGYWQNPEATAATFVERDGQRWVRTGDLGVARDQELFIAGRQKDVIILNGQNVYPQDIEGILEREIELLRQGRISAFATTDDQGAEGIGLALEIGRSVRKMVKPEMICATLAETLTEQLQLAPQLILLLEPGTLPRTTSGKLQRSACRIGWQRRKLAVFAAWQQGRMLDQDGADATGQSDQLMPEVVSAWREVLGQAELNERSHFFALGGDSVALMQVLSRLNHTLGIEVAPGALFECPRLGEFSACIAAARNQAPARKVIPVRPEGEESRQSHAQQRLWFLDRLEGGSSAYHLSGEWRLQGDLNLAAVQRSLDDLAVRHDNLRTVFAENDRQQPVQRVLAPQRVSIQQHDVSASDDAGAALTRLNRDLVQRPMDLANGPLWQVHLVKVADRDHRLLLIVHHIIADGWSAQVLVREFADLYTAHSETRAADLPELPIRYTDYAHWQRELLAGAEGERQLAFWKQQLGHEHPVLELPADRPRPEVQSHRGARLSFAFPADLSAQIRALARERGVTLFMLMLALYKTQLYRYSGQRDLRVGVPVAGRGRPETEGLVGLFVNTLVLRSQPAAGQSFNELLEAVQTATQGAQAHAELPFEQLVDALQPERNLRHNPLCQVKFTQQFPLPDNLPLPGLTLSMSQRDDDTAHFDLGLDITDQADRIEAVLTYACDLFDRARIQSFADDLVHLAAQITANPARRLGELELLAARSELQGPELQFPHQDVLALWRGHIDTSRDQQALQFEAGSYDYGWLEVESNRLAQTLQRQGVGNGQRVALCLDRSPEFVVALLAVLKAGGAFVPLDPKWPQQRQALVLADCGARLVLANEDIAGFDGQRIGLAPDAIWRSASEQAPRTVVEADQAAYVIYTSGTSGKPKGVVVSHGALANYVQGLLHTLKPSAPASMAMVSTVAADLGHTTLFGALCSGRTLHLLSPDRVMDAEAFASYMARHRVDVLKIVPTHLAGLLQADNPARVLPAEALVLGGEALPAELARRVQALAPVCRIFNHYGPSESTVGVLTTSVLTTDVSTAELADEHGDTVPLGTPLPNICVRVCSDEGLVLPQGAVGELQLSGAGLARGYLGQPEQTAEAFRSDPQRPGQRWYATGDAVQLLADGRLTFHGRRDDQVKIRGYRITLGEIAQRIRAFDGVRDAHVQLDDHGQLVAYPLADNLSVESLQQSLAQQLPDYMVPAHILPLTEFPLTANGKLDRRALPQPDRQSEDYAAPRAGTETVLAGLWQALLKVEQVGRHDNFFSLGGDSIISLQVIARARKQGIKLTPKQLFEKQTIAELAEVTQLSEGQPAAAAQSSAAVADFPLIPVQQRFFELAGEQPRHWNQSVRLVARAPLQADALRQALAAVVQVHPSLRLRFNPQHQTQNYRPDEKSDLLWELDATDDATLLAHFGDAHRSLNLNDGPLVRVVWARLPDDRQELMIAIHHLAVDGVSWRILLADLQQAYEQALAGQAIALDTPAAGFHEWSQYLQRELTAGRFEPELAHWQQFTQADAELPCDRPDGSARIADREQVSQTLDATLTGQLLTEAPRTFRTQINDLLLAALAEALRSWSGRDRTVITLEGHGRHGLSGAPDVSRTVGWFTTLYPVALEAGGDTLATLRRTKDMLRAVPSEGLGYGVLKQLATEQQRKGAALAELTGTGLTFNYLGRFEQAAEASLTLHHGDTGASRDSSGPMANAVVVDGQVRDGQLQLAWSYSRARFSRERIEQLMDGYLQALTELVRQCVASDGGLTPTDVPLTTLDQASLDTLTDAANIEDILPLAPMQEGILLHSQLEQGSGIYLMQDQYAVGSEIDFEAFRAAWQAVVQRHPVLRTGFRELGGRQYQVVCRQVAGPAQLIDLSHLARDAALEKLDALLARERTQGFDFAQPPLLRLRLVRFGEADYRIVQSHHHVLIDAWCRGLMLAEFFANYQGIMQGQTPSLPPARPYRDFIAWLAGQDEGLARDYWRGELSGFTEITPLPYQRSGVGEEAGEVVMADVSLGLDAKETAGLADTARGLQLTVNTFMQAAWALLLMRHSGLDEVLFGVTVAGRPTELDGIEETLGLFINTLPLRVTVEGQDQSVLAFLSQLQGANAAMRQHEHLSLAEVQNLAGTPRGDALFDSLFVFENVPLGPEVQAAASQYGITPLANRTHTNYPLTVVILPGESYQLQFSYDSRLFRETDMKALLGQYRQLLRQLVANRRQSLAELHLVTAAERTGLEELGQGPEAKGWMLTSYLERFEAWGEAVPEREVARCQGEGISYDELNRKANRLGHGLIAAGVQPDDVVALYAPRGLNLLTMIIGAFKAGGAYLALDERHPPARSARMLHSSQAPVLLTPETCLDQVEAILAEFEAESTPKPRVFTLESLLASGSDHNPGRYPDMEQLAYVIYTSGSTGEPKGVMVNQQGMLNNQLSKVPYLELGEGDVIAQTAATGFDISVWQFLTAPLFGGRVEIIPDEVTHDPQRLLAEVAANGVTVLESVPAVIEGILSGPNQSLNRLRWLLPTGEALGRELARRWFERYGHVPLVNAYGPAECADDVALHTLQGVADTHSTIPIGTPTDNNRLYVLDSKLELVPHGVVGELYVGGTGVGRGYAGQPGLTAERFLPNPFGKPGERLYRTGDLARWNDQRVLEYAGRADFQVKIRGQRIEPGEIESCLLASGGIRQAVVAAQSTPHGSQLVGYLVLDSGAELDTEDLKERLAAELPATMVPTHLLVLDQLPLNANGKLDRKRLPKPEIETQHIEPPQGELEQTLAGLWQDLLHVEQVGRNQHFFELGGHSLLATRLLSRIRETFDVSVPLAQAFEATTVAAMAEVIEGLQERSLDQGRLDSLDALMSELEEME